MSCEVVAITTDTHHMLGICTITWLAWVELSEVGSSLRFLPPRNFSLPPPSYKPGFFKGEIHVEPRPSLPATKAIGDRLAFRIDFPLSLIPLAVVVLQWHGWLQALMYIVQERGFKSRLHKIQGEVSFINFLGVLVVGGMVIVEKMIKEFRICTLLT